MPNRNRLPGVDGLRAFAALWVVLFHISALSHAQFPQVPGLDLFMKSGSTGVSLFLVLSGFCLYLPFAGGRNDRFKTGSFLIRRCRRLLPAYYTSLVLVLVLTILVARPLKLPELTLGDLSWQVATHAVLAHSLFSDTFYALNGAYWSLGLEWQLYLGLPLLILGVRRFGLAPTLVAAGLCNVVYRLALAQAIGHDLIPAGGAMATVVLPNQIFGRWAEFALGMLAADLYARRRLDRLARFVPVLQVALVALVPVALLAARFELGHIVYGTLFFCLLCLVLINDNVVSRVFAQRPLVAIGTMSYSLYLVHQPVIQTFVEWMNQYQPDVTANQVFFLLLLLVPVILLLAWIMFMAVERRSLGPDAARALTPSFSFLPRPRTTTLTRQLPEVVE